MKRYLPFVFFALLIPFFLIGLFRDPSVIPSPFLQKPAPEFDLPSLTQPQLRVRSSDYAGKVALINIWATWCPGCRAEHPFLNRLAQTGTIPVYGINWRDNREDALRWLDQLGDPYEASGFDGDGRTGIDWGAYGAPESFLVSAEGIVLHKYLGPLTEEVWRREFAPLITAEGTNR